jgi:predicted MPP superfamily phosphohydrolase
MDAVHRSDVHLRRVARSQGLRTWLRRTLVVLVALVGGAIGWSLAPPTTTYLGPLEVQVRVVPSLQPGVEVMLPPVGQVRFHTHSTPVAVHASVKSVNLDQASQLISSPQGLLALQLGAPDVVEDAARKAIAKDLVCALAGAAIAGLVVYRMPRRGLQTTASALAALLVLGAGTAATFDPGALRQPKFTGLLSRAPYIAGEGQDIAKRLESYRSGLADFVSSVTTLYAVADKLPVPRTESDTTTVLHISDIHLNPLGFDLADQLVKQFHVDAVVDTGDITTWGTDVESPTLSRIGKLGVPYVFVRGNHDSRSTQAAVARQPNAVVLDRDVAEVAGLTFAGIGDPVFTPSGEAGTGDASDVEQVGRATEQLAGVVQSYDEQYKQNPDGDTQAPQGPSPLVVGKPTGRGVDVALIHDPSRLDSLFGQVPLVLTGHYHRRIVRLDDSGTRVMVQGSTGGAGLTAAGLQRLGDGEPLPMTATLLHFAKSGERAGQLVSYDQVTVGGLGLTSVTVERTTVPADAPRPTPSPSDTPTDSSSPSP